MDRGAQQLTVPRCQQRRVRCCWAFASMHGDGRGWRIMYQPSQRREARGFTQEAAPELGMPGHPGQAGEAQQQQRCRGELLQWRAGRGGAAAGGGAWGGGHIVGAATGYQPERRCERLGSSGVRRRRTSAASGPWSRGFSAESAAATTWQPGPCTGGHGRFRAPPPVPGAHRCTGALQSCRPISQLPTTPHQHRLECLGGGPAVGRSRSHPCTGAIASAVCVRAQQDTDRVPSCHVPRVRRFKGALPMPNIGYGSNKKTRHTLPNGFLKYTVNNVKDLELLMMHNRWASG